MHPPPASQTRVPAQRAQIGTTMAVAAGIFGESNGGEPVKVLEIQSQSAVFQPITIGQNRLTRQARFIPV